MLKIYSLLLLWLLAAAAAWAAPTPAAPDTIPGQQQLIRRLTTDACQRLRAPATGLSAAQAQQELEEAVLATLDRHAKQAEKLAAGAPTPDAGLRFRQNLSSLLALQLVRDCPAARQRYELFQQTIPAPDPAEKLLHTISNDLCASLARHQANGDFAHRTPAQRMELFHTDFKRVINTYSEQLQATYGAQASTPAGMDQLSAQLVDYMKQQCPNALLSLGK
jgi:hypothetical protein